MKKQMTALLSCVALGLMLVTASVFATETFNPKIYQVFVDDDGLMTIVGTGFPDGAYVQTLKVGGSPVDPGSILYDADNDTIQGSLGNIPPGDYRLLVNLKKGNVKKNMIWDLSIGAQGPQGEQGKLGPQGEPGTDGAGGTVCPCEPAYEAAFAHVWSASLVVESCSGNADGVTVGLFDSFLNFHIDIFMEHSMTTGICSVRTIAAITGVRAFDSTTTTEEGTACGVLLEQMASNCPF